MKTRFWLNIGPLTGNTVAEGIVARYVGSMSYDQIQVDLERVCQLEVYNLVNKTLEDTHGSNTRRNQAEG